MGHDFVFVFCYVFFYHSNLNFHLLCQKIIIPTLFCPLLLFTPSKFGAHVEPNWSIGRGFYSTINLGLDRLEYILSIHIYSILLWGWKFCVRLYMWLIDIGWRGNEWNVNSSRRVNGVLEAWQFKVVLLSIGLICFVLGYFTKFLIRFW